MHTKNVKKRSSKVRVAREWRPEAEILCLLGMVLAALLFVSPAMAQDGEAHIRMVHLSPDAPSVMVEVDGEPVEALSNVSYRDASPYLPIPAGPHDVAVYAVGDPSEPVLEVSITPEAGESYTVAGVGLLEDDTFGARLFEDDNSEPDEGRARVRVIHAVPDVGPATVSVENGPELFTLPGFANASDYAEVDAGTYTFELTPAGAEEPAFEIPDVEVEEGEVYTAFAIGQASEGTLDTLMTVDSDDGRILGPQRLRDTSGDDEPDEGPGEESAPQPQSATTDAAAKEVEEHPPAPPENVEPAEAAPAEAPPAEAHQPAPAVVPPPAPAPAPAYEAPEPVAVPTVQEIVPETLVNPEIVTQTVSTVPVSTEVLAPVVSSVPSVTSVSVSGVSVTQVTGGVTQTVTQSGDVVGGVVSGVTQTATQTVTTTGVTQTVTQSSSVVGGTTQTVTQGGVTSGVTGGVTQAVSQQTGNVTSQLPVGTATGIVSNPPAVLSSVPRRKFVTIRKRR